MFRFVQTRSIELVLKNNLQVNSNVLHVPEKNDKKNDGPLVHDAPPPPPPPPPYIQPYQEPISTSKYLYFNFNMADAVIVALLVAAFVFATKKAYQRCFPKKVAPQLPTTLPPTYSPSHIVVETTSKKVPQWMINDKVFIMKIECFMYTVSKHLW